MEAYYEEDLQKLRDRVDKCNIDTLDSLEFFLREANAYTEGISKDLELKIREEIYRFKNRCRCEKRFP